VNGADLADRRIGAAGKRIRYGRRRAGRLPALGDGRAAERIVDVLMSTWR